MTPSRTVVRGPNKPLSDPLPKFYGHARQPSTCARTRCTIEAGGPRGRRKPDALQGSDSRCAGASGERPIYGGFGQQPIRLHIDVLDAVATDKAFAAAVRQAPSLPAAHQDWGNALAARGDLPGARGAGPLSPGAQAGAGLGGPACAGPRIRPLDDCAPARRPGSGRTGHRWAAACRP